MYNKKGANWVIIGMFAVLLAVSLVYLISPGAFLNIKKPLATKHVSLDLFTNGKDFGINDLIEVNIYLDNDHKKSAGVDVMLQYDPSFLAIKPLKRNELTGAVITGNAIL